MSTNKDTGVILNIVLQDHCPDDMETWERLISFEVDASVVNPRDAFESAVREYISEQKKELDEDETITWMDIYRDMPDELFEKHGLHRRPSAASLLYIADCDDVPFEEESE